MIDCLRRHEERCRNLPWWRKDYYGWPIETFKGKKFKSFTRLVCINIKKPFQRVYWWWRRRKGPGKFETMAFPIIQRMDYQKAGEQILSVQPEKLPAGLVFYLDFVTSEPPKSKPEGCEWETEFDKKKRTKEKTNGS